MKDYKYYMILSNNKTMQSMKQLSVLKVLLKWRDYIARIEDESPDYVLPKSVMFTIGKEMPTTRNELKDCYRSSSLPMIMKHQDTLL